jgi:hypothetical protein
VPPGSNARIARWDGFTWTILEAGIPPLSNLEDLLVLDDGAGAKLYASVGVNFIWQWYVWNGASWSPPPPRMFVPDGPEASWPLCSYDDGDGSDIYGIGDGGIAKWDGGRWHRIGTVAGFNNYVLQPFDLGDGPNLYYFGQHDGIQGVPNTRGIARWDGQQWHALGTGVIGSYLEACVFDSGNGKELYIAGSLVSAGGIPAKIAKWNGQQWSAVPFPSPGALDQMVVFDDGYGPGLVAKGPVGTINGQNASFVKFDGQNWSVLPGPANTVPTSEMVVFNEDPRGASIFMFAGGGAGFVNQFVGCAGGRGCYADCDNSTPSPRVTANDFACYLDRFVSKLLPPFSSRDPYADCNRDGLWNVADFQCYITKFAAGCP